MYYFQIEQTANEYQIQEVMKSYNSIYIPAKRHSSKHLFINIIQLSKFFPVLSIFSPEVSKIFSWIWEHLFTLFNLLLTLSDHQQAKIMLGVPNVFGETKYTRAIWGEKKQSQPQQIQATGVFKKLNSPFVFSPRTSLLNFLPEYS